MVAALMVEGVPLATADELAGSLEELQRAPMQTHGLHQHGALAPRTGGSVQVVMGVPVVDQLAKLTSEDGLTNEGSGGRTAGHSRGRGAEGFLRLEVIARPTIEHVVVIGNTGGMHISSSHRTIGIRILVLGDLQSLKGEVLRIACLVQDGFPHQDTRVVTVAADDRTGVLMHLCGKLRVFVPILPAWSSHDDEEAQLVTGIHEGRILRIVRRADNGKAQVTQALGIAPLLRVRKGVTHISEVLMAVGTNKLMVLLAIEVEAGDTPLGNGGCRSETRDGRNR